MGRPRIAPDSHGIVNYCETSPGRFRARVRYRDRDGIVRYVAGFGTSKSAANTALQESLKRRQPVTSSSGISGETPMSVLAEVWLASIESSRRARSTRDRYAYVTRRFIVPGMGALRVGEVTVELADHFLKAVLREHEAKGHSGVSTARTARACLSLMLRYAVVRGALTSNPVREVDDIDSDEDKPAPDALTPEQLSTLVRKLRGDKLAHEHDLVDLVVFLAGTGCRIGEAIALREPEVDLRHGRVEIKATMTDRGLQERPKTKAGHRVIAVPPHIVDLLARRMADPAITTSVALFPSPMGRLRDTSNTAAHLRRAFNRAGYAKVTAHTFRRTVATRLDDAKLSARAIAEHLGHSHPSMTQDAYLARKVVTKEAAVILTPP